MKHFLTGSLAAALVIAATSAHAEQAFTSSTVQIGANVDYGIYVGKGDVNPYGFGLGARGGYTLDMNVYVGASFEYYFGESNESLGASLDVRLWNLMFEPGYDFAIGDTMVIRPQLGIGLTSVHAKACANVPGLANVCDTNTDTKLALAPGATYLIDFGGFFGMAGLRWHHIFTSADNTDGLLINVGAGAMF